LGNFFCVFPLVAKEQQISKEQRCKDGEKISTDKTIIVALNTTMQVALMSSLVDVMRRPRSVFVLASLFTLSIVASIYLSHGHESNRQDQIFRSSQIDVFHAQKVSNITDLAQAGGGSVV
jgi:hypothetical protein